MPVKSILDQKDNLSLLKKLYCEEKMSTTQITSRSLEFFGKKMSVAPIYTALKRNGIQIRSKSESISVSKCKLDQEKSFLNEDLISWIDGFLLGDGSISPNKNKTNARFAMGSTEKEWTEFAISKFSDYSPSIPKQYGKKRDNAPNLSWTSMTCHHPDILSQYNRWYPENGNKKVPEDVRLTPSSILLWYLGDGSITKSGVSYVVRLATCSFSPEEIEDILIPKLKGMGLSCKRDVYKNDIKFATESVKRFFEIIGSSSPISCYRYKFEFNQWLNYYRLSQIASDEKTKWRIKYLINQGKLNCTRSPGGKLILFNEEQKKKVEDIIREHELYKEYPSCDSSEDDVFSIKYKDIAVNSIEKWNSKYFINKNLIENKNGLLNEDGAKSLRKKLNFYGYNSAVPKKDINRIYRQYREQGFPHITLTDEEIKNKIKKIGKDNGNMIWDGFGTDIATYFHPHIFECKKPNKMSPIEFFNSEDDFKRGISKLLCLYNNISDSKIREICRNENKSSRINNFPPRVVVKVLNSLNIKDAVMLDPCHGFSGRLIGAYASGKIKKYIGVDISKYTHNGAMSTKDWIEKNIDSNMEIELINKDCISCIKNVENSDIIFTSPPFLDVEIYKGVSFETNYNKWKKEFIRPFVKNCYENLKSEGFFVLYLEKIKKCNFIEDFIEISLENGFKQERSINFEMAYGENNRCSSSKRLVPILVFNK